MLRASGRHDDQDLDVAAITDAHGMGSGVLHGDRLVRLADATLGDDDLALSRAQASLVAVAGGAGLVDAAATIANFSMQSRIANGTGIPLDTSLQAASRALRSGPP